MTKTNQIDSILKKTVPDYVGTFSCDRLPNEKTGIMVSNTDPQHLPGTHWIAIYISNDRLHGEYFDSFGREPNEHFENYMNNNCKYWTWNSRQLQSVVSSYCGHYCILYCICKAKGIDMIRFVNCFTRDTGLNDRIVCETLKGFKLPK